MYFQSLLKLCKMRSVGLISNENPNRCDHCFDGDEDSDPTLLEEGSNGDQPNVVPSKSRVVYGDQAVVELFDVVAGLKMAYVQLQEAHVPYAPDRIVAADELVVAQLEALCRIKRSYIKGNSFVDCLQREVESNERLLGKLKSETRAKDVEIFSLRRKLDGLNLVNATVAKRIMQRNLDAASFEEAFEAASKAIHDFAKPVISLMKASGWDLDLAADSIESGVANSKRAHKKYAFEAYIARRMFSGASLKSHNVDDAMRYDDPIDSLTEDPDSGFGHFCRKKYLFVVHPVMEMSFFGNLDQRILLLSGSHPRTAFYQIFARMAKWVWMLQGTATSVDPKAVIFAVSRGNEFSSVYMEPVEEIVDGASENRAAESNHRVELMVMPGFKIGDRIMRSRVYVTRGEPRKPC